LAKLWIIPWVFFDSQCTNNLFAGDGKHIKKMRSIIMVFNSVVAPSCNTSFNTARDSMVQILSHAQTDNCDKSTIPWEHRVQENAQTPHITSLVITLLLQHLHSTSTTAATTTTTTTTTTFTATLLHEPTANNAATLYKCHMMASITS